MTNHSNRFESLLKISHELNYNDDLDSVLDSILTNCRLLTGAEAGTIFLREGDELVFEHTQNDLLFNSNLDNKNNYQNIRIKVNDLSIAGFTACNAKTEDGQSKVLNIPDVYSLPGTHPFTFDSSFDIANNYRSKSMLAVPINSIPGENIGVIQIINCKKGKDNTVSFGKDDEIILSGFADLAAVHIDRARITREMILRMIKMAELRDPKETGTHVNRVGAYSAELYEHWALKQNRPKEEIKKIKGEYRLAAMLHDVGKVGISDTILKKPGPFTNEERKIMQNHTIYGTELFKYSSSSMDKLASEISISHHENWDGTGYPGNISKMGLIKEEIPLSGRIVKLTDVYDALMSERCYKEAWDEQKVLDEIERNRSKEFDPQIVDCFLAIYETIRAISVKYEEEIE